jgi:hypothetical protein
MISRKMVVRRAPAPSNKKMFLGLALSFFIADVKVMGKKFIKKQQ